MCPCRFSPSALSGPGRGSHTRSTCGRPNRESRFDSDVTNGVDHYSVQGALGLALAALPPLAGVRADLRRLVPACCGVVAAYLGLVSYAWPDAAGGFSRPWSVAAMAWGVALIALSLVEPALSARTGDQASRRP